VAAVEAVAERIEEDFGFDEQQVAAAAAAAAAAVDNGPHVPVAMAGTCAV
jgi:hypothetical protein